jgi:hypothetical protein
MRAVCLGLLLFAAVSGCATPESESSGFLGNYGGFPWPSLLRKNAEQNPDDSFTRPQFNGSGRFAPGSSKPIGSVTPNPVAADQAADEG